MPTASIYKLRLHVSLWDLTFLKFSSLFSKFIGYTKNIHYIEIQFYTIRIFKDIDSIYENQDSKINEETHDSMASINKDSWKF